MRAYVISLPTATSRRERITAMLDGIGAGFVVVDAVSGAEIVGDLGRYCPDTYCPRFFREMRPNEIACSVSHRKALLSFLADGGEHGLFLEDDAEISCRDHRRLRALVADMPEFDILKVGGIGERLRGVAAAEVLGVTALAVAGTTVCAHGYVVSRRGAERLASSILPVRAPYDAFLRDLYRHGCECFETAPRLVGLHEQHRDSTIGGDYFSRRCTSSIKRTLQGMAFRLRHNAGRLLFNVRRFGISYLLKAGFVELPADQPSSEPIRTEVKRSSVPQQPAQLEATISAA